MVAQQGDGALDPNALAGAPARALALVPRATGGELSPATFFGASMSILFLFFTVGFAAKSIAVERREGVLARVLAAPVPASSVVLGKQLAVAVLGVGGLVTVWLVTTVAFGASWGPPGWVLAVIVATVVAVSGVGALVAGLARTEQQADTFTSLVAFVLALLGGNFLAPGSAPPGLQRLSRLTPNGWSLQAFTDLATGAATTASTMLAVVVLVAFGIAGGAVGLRRIHRGLAR